MKEDKKVKIRQEEIVDSAKAQEEQSKWLA